MAANPTLEQMRATVPERYSVQSRADDTTFAPTSDVTGAGLFWIQLGSQLEEEPQYNVIYPHWRDVFLQRFARSEPMLASAVYSMATRISGLNYQLNGPPRAKKFASELLTKPGLGDNLNMLIQKVVSDLHTADNGAFVELWRAGNPLSDAGNRPVLGFAHLDSRQCWRSYDPEYPVWYTNPITHAIRKIHRSRIVFTSDNPQPNELARGIGFCATSRVLRMTRIFKNMQIYLDEKVSGRFTRAIGGISGVNPQQLRDALTQSANNSDAKGFVVYKDIPILVSPNMEKGNDIKMFIQDLASIPDGFVFRDDADLYAYVLAFAFGVDAREFWPATQSGATKADATVQNMKARGRGIGNDIQLVEGLIRQGLPESVTFEFDFTDDEQDKSEADLHKVIADTHKTYVDMGAINAQEARVLAIAKGILDGEVLANNNTPLDSDDNPDTPDDNNMGNVEGDGKPDPAQPTAAAKVLGDAFVYVPLPNDSQILAIQDRLRVVLGINGIEYQAPETFHVTMLYCSNVTDEQLQGVMDAAPIGSPMQIVSQRLGVFENREERALYLEVERDDNLITLQNNIYQTFVSKGLFNNLSPFSAPGGYKPHITLAYLPSGIDVPELSIDLSTTATRYAFGRDNYQVVATKTYNDYRRSIRSLVRGFWNGELSEFDFVDDMATAIERQFPNAWNEGAKLSGVQPDERTEAEQDRLTLAINTEISYLTGFADAIKENSKANGGSLQPLLDRGELWAQGYERIILLAQSVSGADLKMKWVRDKSKASCVDCIQYDGKVYRKSEWAEVGVYPRSPALACSGINCGCDWEPTNERKTRGKPPPLIGSKHVHGVEGVPHVAA